MTIAGDLLRDIKNLSGLLERAQSELENGTLIDLEPLEPQVEDICQRVGQLPAGEGETVRPRLQALIDDLGRLGTTIETRMAELKGAIGQAGDRNRALGAYTRSGSGQ